MSSKYGDIMRLCELRQKDVINCRDGKRLGHIYDLCIDSCTGKISHFIVSKSCKIFGIIGGDEEQVIPFQCVKVIGKDVVVVDIEIKCK